MIRRVKPGLLSSLRRFKSTSSDKVVNVSLNDKTPDVKNFYNYTWGRWLVNDEQERRARETKFSLPGLVDVVKANVPKKGKAPTEAEIQVKTISPFHEGKHHKIYKVDLDDGRAFALRIPYTLGHSEFRDARMRSEVATMDFLRKKHQLPMPEVYSWCSVAQNPIEAEYFLMEFVPGELLMQGWNPASTDIKAKSSTIKPVVDLMDKIISTKFNKLGSLYFTEDVDAELQGDVPFDGETEFADRWRIGPTTEARFWKGSSAAIGAPFRGPYTSLRQYLDAGADVQLAYVIDALATPGITEEQTANLEKAKAIFEQYAKIVPALFDPSSGELPPEVYSGRLNHPDLSPMNIISPDADPSAFMLVDYESTAVRPFLLHGVPRFVQHKGPKVFSKQDVPDYESLSETDKKTVDHFMAQTQNQFAFEFLFKQSAPSASELFAAFTPNVKRRQQFVDSALHATAATVQDLAYDIAMLAQEWKYLGIEGREFPVPYSAADLERAALDIEAWNKFIMENPFVETKGWVPVDMFDKLVAEGTLVKQPNGDHKFVTPSS
ncbi:hypothetical protein TRVA0_001S07228 [Trichomonascus vanleenenianus]|uniref:Aim9p n=1 Tax=Trichomonascus vanleenenianus TaxID=2268995 RepID=UPI003EC9ECC7